MHDLTRDQPLDVYTDGLVYLDTPLRADDLAANTDLPVKVQAGLAKVDAVQDDHKKRHRAAAIQQHDKTARQLVRAATNTLRRSVHASLEHVRIEAGEDKGWSDTFFRPPPKCSKKAPVAALPA